MYSYKLKKSGNNNDGTMLVGMKVDHHIHELDCIAINGGYTQYIKKMTEDTSMTKKNFCFPIRKSHGKDLAKDEANYNNIFGSFRSQMEDEFGKLGTIFELHNNHKPVLVTKVDTYNLQLRLCLLLMNIKRMVALLAIKEDPMHKAWMKDGFDYPATNNTMEQLMDYPPVAEILEDAHDMAKLQDEFLKMNMEVEEEEVDDEPPPRKRQIISAVVVPPAKHR
ncbi:hypothetical protein BGZ81_003285 [Podila clonocystis]|nr:hypothetical protein BGZ81_003285 [Podila clonocystis]